MMRITCSELGIARTIAADVNAHILRMMDSILKIAIVKTVGVTVSFLEA